MWMLDLVAASLLGVLLLVADPVAPVSQQTRSYEALQQLIPVLQTTIEDARSTSNATSTSGLNENDGATLFLQKQPDGSTMLTEYAGRPIGATALPTRRLAHISAPLTINQALPFAIFVGPSGTVTFAAGWTPGATAAAAAACTNLTFASDGATVTMDCATGDITAPALLGS